MQALPSSPVLVWGLSDVPSIGDQFEAFKNEKEAKSCTSGVEKIKLATI